MPQVTVQKGHLAAGSVAYGAWDSVAFPALSTPLTNTSFAVVQSVVQLPFAFKVYAVTIATQLAQVGGTSLGLNIACGLGALNGVGPIDQTNLGVTPTATATNGNQLLAAALNINTVANTTNATMTYVLQPGVDGFDMVFPATLPISLRYNGNASTTAGTLIVKMFGTPFDLNPQKPEIGAFINLGQNPYSSVGERNQPRPFSQTTGLFRPR